ncbi:uncharacterized protein LOC9644667 [Selaginella moellendorffii]|uniref:uncharacterized protein LOC9644667 n=1 Tax=Selaginella moellendorffii TaxID=88036 RepID=UPI000D1C66A0|nr:uncharacterized protein LOC9644667 [Selaginella moellendorffii]|eukprot:XP_024544952.1 uncharacterized protein LOC9644667 [Selaginella moellendorffii]
MAGACSIAVVAAPSASLIRRLGGKPFGECKRVRGFRGRIVSVGARKNAGDFDFDEMPVVEQRKNGRFFLEIDSEDDQEDDRPSKPARSKEAGAAASKRLRPSRESSPSRQGGESMRLRKRSDFGGDDEVIPVPKKDVPRKDGRSRMVETRTRTSSTGERSSSSGERSFSSGERSSSVRKMTEETAERISSRREKKNPPLREQVYLPSLVKKNPQVAILGGGMSGLVCALTLEERGIRSTVFDTGKHGLGGRMGTRDIVHRDGKRLVFDHAAQYFTVKDPMFQKLVDQWLSEGAVKEWDGVVGMLREGEFSPLPHSVKYVATHGMRLLADHMVSKARLITIQHPCWISSMEVDNGTWNLKENDLGQGQFDAVVIAHNGKCANRLLGPSGAPLVAKQMKRLELSSVWALLAAFDEPLPAPADGSKLDGAFVEGINSLSWMGNNSQKLYLNQHPHCWTFFSTAAYGKKHKVPQESIPTVKAERVRREVLRGVEMALGIPEGTLPAPFYTRVQLWGAALPTNTPGVPCIFDAHARVGICGDWLLGASLESAARSGMALAHHIADYCEKSRDGYVEDSRASLEKFSIGLDMPLSALESHDIGEFPGATTPRQQQISGRALAVARAE